MNLTSETPAEDDPCSTYPSLYLNEQFYLVTVAGSLISLASILSNCLLLTLFSRKVYFRQRIYFYLIILGVFDLIIGLTYVAVFSVCVLYEYTENVTIMRVWYAYVLPIYSVQHVIRCASSYLIVAFSLERYLSANWFSGFCTVQRRTVVVVGKRSSTICYFANIFNSQTTYSWKLITHGLLQHHQ